MITTIKELRDETDVERGVIGYEVICETGGEGTFAIKVDLSECDYDPLAARMLRLVLASMERESRP